MLISNSNVYNHLHDFYRCNIPVVIMGETGCGKTRLIRYMCDLAARGCKDGGNHVKNMLIMKVQIFAVNLCYILNCMLFYTVGSWWYN